MTPHSDTNSASAGNDALRPLALLASGMTGADVERLIRELRAKCRRQRRPLTWSVVENALRDDKSMPSLDVLLQIAAHEIGHAFAHELLRVGEVRLVRLGPTLGVTELAIRPEAVVTAEGADQYIVCLMAGRAAEKLLFGNVMLGSGGSEQSDLAQATHAALQLETILGVAEEYPLVYRAPSQPGDMLLYRPDIAKRIQRRLEKAEARAVDLLGPFVNLIAVMASRLVDAQVVEGEAIRTALTDHQGGSRE
jgi:ATP-dependent Zn protease